MTGSSKKAPNPTAGVIENDEQQDRLEEEYKIGIVPKGM